MRRLRPWLRFFRVVNVPTVPGDVLLGASAALVGMARVAVPTVSVVAAAVGAVAIYLFGLADNDIVGAATDKDRPIPDGEISLGAARLARGLMLAGALVAGAAANLPPAWWLAAFALAVAVVAYNRTKVFLLMGLCRGLNVLCGAAVIAPHGYGWCEIAAALVATAYVAAVTRYSEGEEADPERRRRVGWLVGAIVYLQLVGLMVFLVKPLLIAGAVLLVALRILKRSLPEVSAS